MVGWREKTDHISLSEVGRACESYVMLLGYGARRGVNKTTLQWDRPRRCLVTNILNKARLPKGNTGIGLMHKLVASRKYAKRQGKAKQSISGASDSTGSFFLNLAWLESRPTQVVNKLLRNKIV